MERTIFSLLVSSGLQIIDLSQTPDLGTPWADGDNKRIMKMTSLRKQDRSDRVVPERTERVFDTAGLWYFRTREGGNVGPFRYQSEARQMLQNFIRDIQSAALTVSKSSKPHFRLNAVAANTGSSLGAVGFRR